MNSTTSKVMYYQYGSCVTFKAYCRYKDDLYYSSNIFNGLFKIPNGESQPIFLGIFPNELILRNSLHSRAICYKNKLFFIPRYASKLAVFTPDTGKIESVECSPYQGDLITDSVVVGNKLFLFYSKSSAGIIEMDLDTFKYTVICRYRDWPLFSESSRSIFVLGNNVSVSKQYVYAAIWETNWYLVLDTTNSSVTIHETKIPNVIFSGVASTMDKLYFITEFSSILYEYSPQNNAYSIINNDLSSTTDFTINSVIAVNDDIILLPSSGDSILKKESNQLVSLCNFPVSLNSPNIKMTQKWRRFYAYDVIDGKIYVPPFNQNMFLIIDPAKNTCQGISYEYDTDNMEKLFSDIYKPAIIEQQSHDDIIYESKFFSLEDFLNM